MFQPTSRYYELETVTFTTTDGRSIAYKRRRFLPPAEADAVIAEHTVTDSDRLDNITARYLGDPEQFWRLCDANSVMHPQELTAEIGRKIRIAMPQA